MFISELIDDSNIGFERFSSVTDGWLDKEVKTKIANVSLWNPVLWMIHAWIWRTPPCMAKCLGFSEFGSHNKGIVLRDIHHFEVANDLHPRLIDRFLASFMFLQHGMLKLAEYC